MDGTKRCCAYAHRVIKELITYRAVYQVYLACERQFVSLMMKCIFPI